MWCHDFTTDQIDVRWFQERCEFCETRLVPISIPDRWPLDRSSLLREHEDRVDHLSACVEDTYAEHRDVQSDFNVEDVQFRCCPVCGWWCIVQDIHYQASRPYIAFNWASGCLHKHESRHVSTPVRELRQILCANYELRTAIDPLRLEGVVRSIFSSLGCYVEIAKPYQDGGIDIFGWDREGVPFGVQVKRYRNKVRIEEVRAFLGALLLQGFLRGVFVTTSGFTRGVTGLQHQARLKGIQLSCIDASRLLEMLKVAQVKDFDVADARKHALEYASKIPALNFGYCSHLGSL